jgi:hypothetical protein
MFREPRITSVVTTADLVAYKNAYKSDKIDIQQTGFTADVIIFPFTKWIGYLNFSSCL